MVLPAPVISIGARATGYIQSGPGGRVDHQATAGKQNVRVAVAGKRHRSAGSRMQSFHWF